MIMMKNQKNHLKVSNSEIVRAEMPHYYEIKFVNHPNGLEKVHCGTIKDVERMLEMYPDAIYSKILLPHPPETVDVPYVKVAPDLELPMQQILPESQQEPLNL
mgnify:CR=1 FL=1|jgi:hypothetical protein